MVRIIISHDVDHLTVFEHKKDLIVPKFLTRSFIELGIKNISTKEFILRFKDIFKNRWNNIEDLADFNNTNDIPATFFFGVNKGLGLTYNTDIAQHYIKLVLDKGFEVGVHGIEHKNLKKMKEEFKNFKNITKLANFGIRMHYLRMDENTLSKLEKIGYIFDATIYEEKNPFKVGKMWEFPLHIMDGHIFLNKRRWQNIKYKEAIDITKKKIENLVNKGIKYISILFHDRYFSDSFYSWRKWYIQTIEFLKRNNFEFISYTEAIKELENKKEIR